MLKIHAYAIFDGWKECENRALINVIAIFSTRTMFFKALDKEEKVKNGNFIADVLINQLKWWVLGILFKS